jgi:wyosine [tRNA(Phe)-imidazoG37] synthetase (radical SAM superfamily)
VQPPSEQTLHRAYRIFRDRVEQVEYLIGYEGNAFSFTGDVEEDLLSITAVHPMREDAVADYLARAGAGWSWVDQLVTQGQLVEEKHGGHTFYLRKLGDRT